MALAERNLNAEFGDELVDHHTYVLAGDGCLMEGISQEAIALAGHLKLNKLIVIWDNNNISIDGAGVARRLHRPDRPLRGRPAGTRSRIDGHDPEAIADAHRSCPAQSDRPTLIACKTTIGFGAPTKAGTNKVHGSPLGAEEIAGARKALGWDLSAFRGSVRHPRCLARRRHARPARTRKDWEERLAAAEAGIRSRIRAPHRAANCPAASTPPSPTTSRSSPPTSRRSPPASHREMALEVINGVVPETIGGSADLTGSNNTKTSQTKPITAGRLRRAATCTTASASTAWRRR